MIRIQKGLGQFSLRKTFMYGVPSAASSVNVASPIFVLSQRSLPVNKMFSRIAEMVSDR
jgi:hypothetical protein